MNERHEREILHEGGHLRLATLGGWEFAERTRCTGVAMILAVTDEQRLIMTEQYRPPVAGRVIELPAGLIGDDAGGEDESLEAGALRELLEETGYQGTTVEVLAEGPVSAGLTSEVITLVRATGLERVGPGGGDANEDITVHEVELDLVESWLRRQGERGALVDPRIFAALYFARGARLR